LANESKTSLYYRGSAQLRLGPLSAYTNFETGNDLANRTLFATSTIRTTVIGARLAVAAGWDFEMEAYRSSLVAELNPESIFVLQGQGVFVPGVLGGLNQWSVYFRLNKTLRWGKALPVPSLSRYGAELNPLKGQVEGYVTEKTMDGSKPVEGIPVTLDQARTVSTAADGRYHFDDVPEGVHSVGLALQELPADFDPGERREERVSVRPGRLSRGDLEVIRLCAVRGRVEAPAGVPVERILIRLLPTDRYTSPANSGEFFFYNLAEGDYELVLDESTLPQYGAMTSASRVPVAVRSAARSEAAVFSFELRVPGKPVRKVFEKK
jgi:hypothetical protein